MSKKKVSKDSLGDRMKKYEVVSQTSLLRRQYTMLRIDGKAFHTYTKGLKRPFDDDLMEDMDTTAKELCMEIQGAVCAYVQSDEISVLVTDFASIDTQAWFDYNVQKMVSISSSAATYAFTTARLERTNIKRKKALFDSRVFQFPNKTEVENYFIWRQQDATRNSISSMAQSLYSHKELEGKSSNDKQEMIFKKGHNWNELSARYKRGRMIVKKEIEEPTKDLTTTVIRNRWVMEEPPIFTKKGDRMYLSNIIPNFVNASITDLVSQISNEDLVRVFDLLKVKVQKYNDLLLEEAALTNDINIKKELIVHVKELSSRYKND